ncbi:LytTr DNA-binding domain-containing protein [Spirosomataceae bacterium TFI 002]|nr:LytTr DNA-binding domain-containing protein [Spirosomataceae bacterium TFI 002]
MIYQFQNVRGFKKRRLKESDIVLIQADENYSKFYLRSGNHFTLAKTLKECEGIFQEGNFFRSHRSFLVNMDHLKSLERDFLYLENNLQAKVSRRGRKLLASNTYSAKCSNS